MERASKRVRTDDGAVEPSSSLPAPSIRLTVEQASDVMNKLITKYHSKAQTLMVEHRDSQEGENPAQKGPFHKWRMMGVSGFIQLGFLKWVAQPVLPEHESSRS